MNKDPYRVAEVWGNAKDRVSGCGCGWKGTVRSARPIESCSLTIGDPSPAGRCAKCDCLVYIDAKPIRVWTVQFCRSDIGVYDRSWHATEELAREARALLIDKEGMDPSKEMDGTYGCISEAYSVDIPPTLAGLLHFANNYAVDDGTT